MSRRGLHAVEMNSRRDFVGAALRRLHIVTEGRDGENPATVDCYLPAFQLGAGVEHVAIVRAWSEPLDDIALARGVGIARCSKHHPEGNPRVPLGLDLVQPPRDRVLEQADQIALEPHHDRLGLRVSHAAVELEHFDAAVRTDHQAGIQKADIRRAIRLHSEYRWLNDLAHDLGVNRGGHHRRGRIGAHAAGVGPEVPVLQALMVLTACEGQRVRAIRNHDKAGFFPFEEFLDHHARARIAHLVVDQHHVHGRMRFLCVGGNDHALARRKTIRLDDDRRAPLVDVRMGSRRIRESRECAGGNRVSLHEKFRVFLAAFQLGSLTGGPEDLQPFRLECIHDTGCERGFRTDDCKTDRLPPRKIKQFRDLARRSIDDTFFACSTRIARGNEDSGDAARLRQLPGQRMFTSAGSDNEYFHVL